jgi:phosphoglycolate phosphatase
MNVLLDLDGTLTDSRPGILACIQHALEALGEPRAEEVDLHRFIGPPLRDTFAELLRVEVDHDRVEAAISAYRDRFASAGMFENAVYEHIPQALAELAASGANLFVATSKLRVFAERILEHFDLTGHFVAVYGSELDGSRTNKAELIAYAMQRSQLDPTDTVMVGDRSHDILGAIQNEVLPAGVLWGYGSEQELVAAGARRLLAHPRELGKLLHTTDIRGIQAP